MPTNLIVTMQEKGGTSQFNLTVVWKTSETPDITESSVFEIDSKAKCRFRITSCRNGFLLCISLIKMDMTVNATYRISIICKTLHLSEEVICPESWSDWIVVGSFKDYCASNNHYTVIQAEVCVSVYSYIENTVALVKFFNDSDLTDFLLRTEEGSIAVHRAYLAARSDVFKTMLTSKWKETDEGIIEIKGLTLQTLKHLKEYLYLGTLPDENGLRPLLLLASQYCVEDLKAECITKLALTVLPENVHSLLDFACDFKLPELCFAVAQQTRDDVIQQSYMLKKNADTKKAVEVAAAATN